VDDDPEVLELIRNFVGNSAVAEVNHSFSSPVEFLSIYKKLDIDVCLVDIVMPEMNGFEVAMQIKDIPVIFISGHENKLIDAFNLIQPIDVVPKPTRKDRLYRALDKAHKIINAEIEKNDHLSEFFFVDGASRQVRLKPNDIVYAKTDNHDRRHKQVILKSGKKYKLLGCTLERLVNFSPNLIQPNKAELVSTNIIQAYSSGEVILDGVNEGGKPKRVKLNRTYIKGFRKRTGL